MFNELELSEKGKLRWEYWGKNQENMEAERLVLRKNKQTKKLEMAMEYSECRYIYDRFLKTGT